MTRALALTLIFALGGAARAETATDATDAQQQRAAPPETAPSQPAAAAPSPPAPQPAKSPDGTPLPEVPEIGDEPLPQWSGPAARPKAVFMSLHPEMRQSQQLRQAGLWVASIGGAALLTSGILYAHALTVNGDIGLGCTTLLGGDSSNCDGRFHPSLEDEKDRYAAGAITLMAVGGTMVAVGISIFGVGQWEVRHWHKRHPSDPLPPLSGY